MKKILIVGLSVLVVALLTVFLVVPALANDENGENANGGDNDDAWQDMYQACTSGNWEAMQDAMNRIDYDDMPCHNQDATSPSPSATYPNPGASSTQRGISGMMGSGIGGGMMGGGFGGGMMGGAKPGLPLISKKEGGAFAPSSRLSGFYRLGRCPLDGRSGYYMPQSSICYLLNGVNYLNVDCYIHLTWAY